MNLYGMREATQEVKALRAECERLRGLLAIARDGLNHAYYYMASEMSGHPANRYVHNAIARSDPDADPS